MKKLWRLGVSTLPANFEAKKIRPKDLVRFVEKYKQDKPNKKEPTYSVIDAAIAKENFVFASNLLHAMGECEGKGHYFYDRTTRVLLGLPVTKRKM